MKFLNTDKRKNTIHKLKKDTKFVKNDYKSTVFLYEIQLIKIFSKI